MPVIFAVIIGLVYLIMFPSNNALFNESNISIKNTISKTWSRMAIWMLVSVTGLLAIGSLWFLVILPSDAESGIVGGYTLARLLLMTGPVLIGILVFFLAIKMSRDVTWTDSIANYIFGDILTVPRILTGCTLLAGSFLTFIIFIRPEFFDSLSTAHLQRLLPYLAGPLIVLIIMGITWRILWSTIRLEPYFFLLLGTGLIAISWLGRLNPGGYYNVFIPAYAGIAILFGLGLGTILESPTNASLFRNIMSTIVLLLSSAQLFILLSPTSSQIPTQADKDSGQKLVSQIQACSGEVYIPFHTYLAELAGKAGYAGVVEMAELRGSFGGKADPLWDDVLSQIQFRLDANKFTAIIQDNNIFRDSLSQAYVETGRVFENEFVFWPVTGRKTRPELVYELINGDSCSLTVE